MVINTEIITATEIAGTLMATVNHGDIGICASVLVHSNSLLYYMDVLFLWTLPAE